jgi:uncharacterized membrane protein
MNRNVFDLVICSSLAVVAMALALLAPGIGVARVVVGLSLVLFVPGYALVAAAFPSRRLARIERLLFSAGASLAAAVLAGLLLHWTALGLRPAAWAMALGNLTLVANLVALVRRGRLTVTPSALVAHPQSHINSHETGTSLPVSSWPLVEGSARRRAAGLTALEGGLLGLAALLVVGALAIARDGAVQQRATGFTQLWVLPDNAAVEESVRLGVSNREPGQIGYRLLVTASGTIIGSWPRITLGPDEQWETSVVLPTAQPAAATVEAVLYRLDSPGTAYRRVLFRRDSALRNN